jgi:hypothetical protein
MRRQPARNPCLDRRSLQFGTFQRSRDDSETIRRPVAILASVMRDTSEQALDRYYELLRAQTPLARITTAAGLSTAVRELAEAAIRTDDPEAPANVVRARLTRRLYGREVAARLFPGVELDVG